MAKRKVQTKKANKKLWDKGKNSNLTTLNMLKDMRKGQILT